LDDGMNLSLPLRVPVPKKLICPFVAITMSPEKPLTVTK
jgi:hypothetical protein